MSILQTQKCSHFYITWHISLFAPYPIGDCSKVGVVLFFQVTSNRMRGNDLKMHQGKFGLDFGNNFFSERVVRSWSSLLNRVVESLSLKVVKKPIDAALGTWLVGMVVMG